MPNVSIKSSKVAGGMQVPNVFYSDKSGWVNNIYWRQKSDIYFKLEPYSGYLDNLLTVSPQSHMICGDLMAYRHQSFFDMARFIECSI